MAIGQEEQAVQPITMNETVPMDDGVGCVGSNSTTMAAAVTDEGQGKIVTNDGQGTISAAVTNDGQGKIMTRSQQREQQERTRRQIEAPRCHVASQR